MVRRLPFGLLLLLSLAMPMLQASGMPAPHTSEMSPVGQGSLRWWGIPLYDATLLAPQGSFDPHRPHALQLTYHRNFSRRQLARATLDEIERMRGSREDREALIDLFAGLFADVTPGDHLLGVHLPGEAALFYGPGGYLGRLEDADLAGAFFDLWLAPATREPALRQALIGVSR
ncbi:MAG: chalcone isomerase family protein [Candidatus Thiodiazotropha sp.]